MDHPKILDACCGSRMFYFDKFNDDVLFLDNRQCETVLCDGRSLIVSPDILGDFTNLQFNESTFKVVVFDPPHLVKVGDDSWLFKKYGRLPSDWKNFLKKGFDECMRVLEDYGVLIFKWNEEQIKASDILKLIPYKPLLGDKRSKTHWIIFIKTPFPLATVNTKEGE